MNDLVVGEFALGELVAFCKPITLYPKIVMIVGDEKDGFYPCIVGNKDENVYLPLEYLYKIDWKRELPIKNKKE